LLSDNEWELVQKHYVKISHDLSLVGGYVSWENINMLMEMCKKTAERAGMSQEQLKTALTKIMSDLDATEEKLGIKLGPRTSAQRKHENFTNNFLISCVEREDEEARKALVEAAKLRNCLG
jgi:phosphoenolpyruvate carboxylase